jgi:hypothetical protein
MSAVTWSTMWRGALNVLAALLGFSEPVINAPEPDGTTHREWPDPASLAARPWLP